MSINEKLKDIQTKIKAPKNLRNNFGNYNYRNAEGICEAVKPHLESANCSLIISDDIINIGERYYVKATCTLTDCETGEQVSVSALARECADKKGMDDSQITGATSSYARKYALNGMFLLDDTKDADTEEYANEKKAKAEKKDFEKKADDIGSMKISDIKVKALVDKCKNDDVKAELIYELYKIENFKDLTEKQYTNIIENWKKILAKKEN